MKLKHPYQHQMSEKTWKKFFKELKETCKDKRFQFPNPVHRKGVTYGYKISMFILAYRPDFCGENPAADYCPGITKAEWEEVRTKVTKLIKTYIPDAKIQEESWSSSRKFSIQWEAYIQTREP